MKARGAAVQGGLAALGLMVAYATWQRAPDERAGDVTVLNLGRGDIQSIHYDDGQKLVELTLGHGEQEPKVWVHQATRPEVRAAALAAADGGLAALMGKGDGGSRDAGVLPPSHPPIVPPPPPPDRDLRGNEAAEKLFEEVAPLMATRSLGVLPADKLKELGLSETKRSLAINARGTRYAFQVASSAGGLGSPYLRSEGEGRVYVLNESLVNDLDNAASRLVDRRLHELKSEDYDLVRIAAGGKTRELQQKGGVPPQPGKLYPSGSEKADDFATNWHQKVQRIAPVELLGKGELPAAGTPQVTVRVDYLQKGKPVGFLEMGKAGLEWFGRTEHTAGWVKLSFGADDLAQEAAKITSG